MYDMRLEFLYEGYPDRIVAPPSNSVYWISEISISAQDGKWYYVLGGRPDYSLRPGNKQVIKYEQLSLTATMHPSIKAMIEELPQDADWRPKQAEQIHIQTDNSIKKKVSVQLKNVTIEDAIKKLTDSHTIVFK